MAQSTDWTEQDFETLLRSGQRESEELVRLLGRSASAIEVVQQAIHGYHRTGDASVLSEGMIRRLGDRARPASCPVCGARVEK